MNLANLNDIDQTMKYSELSEKHGWSGIETDNPLMRLVDAAASLLNAPLKSKDDEPATVSSLDPQESSVAREAKITLGRKEDLMDSEKKAKFPEQLMDALDNETNSAVIAWMPDGESFAIVDHRKFTLDQMPKLFSIRNMSSFVRKLMRWGFEREVDKSARNVDIFKREHFRRGRRDLLKKVGCVNRLHARVDGPEAPLPTSVSRAVVVGRDTVIGTRTSKGYLHPPISRQPPASPAFMSTLRRISYNEDRFPLVRSSAPPLYPSNTAPALLEPQHPFLRRAALPMHPPTLGSVTSKVVAAAYDALRRTEYCANAQPHFPGPYPHSAVAVVSPPGRSRVLLSSVSGQLLHGSLTGPNLVGQHR